MRQNNMNSAPTPTPATARPYRRRGSVLILVVAVLVLLALIGTAFIATTRPDRFASRQHMHNVQADMAVQSAVSLVVSELTADLYSLVAPAQFKFANDYRPPLPEGGALG